MSTRDRDTLELTIPDVYLCWRVAVSMIRVVKVMRFSTEDEGERGVDWRSSETLLAELRPATRPPRPPRPYS